jgi:eukaryotic translation initiation factor 2C
LTIVPELLQVASTIVRYPSIIYGENKQINLYKEYKGKEGFGETPRWTLNECRFLESGPTAGTGVQVFLLATSQVEALQTELKEALGKYNIGGSGKGAKCAVSHPPPLEDLNDAELRKALQLAKDTFTEGRKKVVVLLLPTPDRTVYQSFKDLADREFGLQALCITGGKVFEEGTSTLKTKGLDQYLGNVMMKINLKCEGINHSAGDNVENFKESLNDKLKDVMILGADVTHPSLVSIEGCPSIAAIVGSIDDFGGKFLGSMRLQNPDRIDREVSTETSYRSLIALTNSNRSFKR